MIKPTDEDIQKIITSEMSETNKHLKAFDFAKELLYTLSGFTCGYLWYTYISGNISVNIVVIGIVSLMLWTAIAFITSSILSSRELKNLIELVKKNVSDEDYKKAVSLVVSIKL